MLFNLRAECMNNNGASMTYTWRGIPCDDEWLAREKALAWAKESESWHEPRSFPYQVKAIKVLLPTDEELWQEDNERYREKAEFEPFTLAVPSKA